MFDEGELSDQPLLATHVAKSLTKPFASEGVVNGNSMRLVEVYNDVQLRISSVLLLFVIKFATLTRELQECFEGSQIPVLLVQFWR